MPIRTRSRSNEGIRRFGVRHSPQPQVFPDGTFTDEEVRWLLDPRNPDVVAELLDDDDDDDDEDEGEGGEDGRTPGGSAPAARPARSGVAAKSAPRRAAVKDEKSEAPEGGEPEGDAGGGQGGGSNPPGTDGDTPPTS